MIENQIASVESELDAPDGEPVIHGGARHRKLSATDGPFAETKEGLGGSIFVDARDPGDVIDVMSKTSLAWLRTIEVRPMMAIDADEPGRMQRLRRSLLDTTGPARRYQTTCPVCGLLLAAGGGVLFQGDDLVHATCWRAAPQPGHGPPDVWSTAAVS